MYYSLENLVEPNEALANLEKMIQEAGQPGEYYANGLSIAPIPKIDVEDVGVLSFPIPEFQAKQMLDVAERSPFGKGLETVIDSSVRDCWHFEPSQVKISGQTWDETFEQILKQASINLGCPPSGLRAELYKLLVYDTGGFFKPHRDTEKAEGMVATLVISLPVEGSGGELIIRHKNQETVISMESDNPSELYWAAFYADCEHEILPVTVGHRICLVYNLIVNSGEEIFEPPPEFTVRQKMISSELQKVSTSLPKGRKLVWVLEHEYTTAGLSFQTLKNVDALVGKLLAEVTKSTDHMICTALLEVNAIYNTTDHGYGNHYYGHDDYGYEEHIETYAYLNDLRFLDGTFSPDLKIPLLAGELMPAGVIDPGNPDEEEFEDNYGNAEPTVDRIYHRAALVLWPRSSTLEVVGEAGVSALLLMFVIQMQEINDQKHYPILVRALADDTMKSLLEIPDYELRDLSRENIAPSLLSLVKTASEENLSEFYKNLAFKYYQIDYNPVLVALLKRLPTSETLPRILEYISSSTTNLFPALVGLAGELYQELPDKSILGSRKNGVNLDNLLEEIVLALAKRVSTIKIKKERWGYSSEKSPIEMKSFANLIDLAGKLSLFEQINALATVIIKRNDLVSPDRDLPKLLSMLHSHPYTDELYCTTLRDLGEHVAGFLLARSATPPTPPTDWRLPKANKLTNLPQSKILREFCLSTTDEVHNFMAIENVRFQLENIIEWEKLDIDCHTIKQGRPYTLVCTKNRNYVQRRLNEYGEDIGVMEQMLSLTPRVKISDPTVTALRNAISMSQNGVS